MGEPSVILEGIDSDEADRLAALAPYTVPGG